jgi:hypothetical protein
MGSVKGVSTQTGLDAGRNHWERGKEILMIVKTFCSSAAICAVLVLLCGTVSAQVPQKINYQVMLTDDADQPLADQSVAIVFTVYDDPEDGTALWTETQNLTTNSIGVVSALIGDVHPIDFVLTGPVWLDVEVDGETLSPRRELATAPYAAYSANSAMLGGTEASEYAKLSDLGGVGDGHSLDAADGSPVDALYVDSNGDVGIGTTSPEAELHVSEEIQVGSASTPGQLSVEGGSPANGRIVLEGEGLFGATIQLENGDGEPVGFLRPSPNAGGGGQFAVGRNDIGVVGLVVDGNYDGSQEPRLLVNGSHRWAIFNMGESGDDSVALPDSSISSAEMLDEPGVASIQSSSWATPSTSVMTVASRFIDAPAAGYVYVSATAVIEFDNRTNQGHYLKLGLSESQNAFSSHAQEFQTQLPGGVYGHYYDTVTVTGIFEVDPGVHNFYLNAQKLTGAIRVGSRQLNVLYFPTAHGTVDTTD